MLAESSINISQCQNALKEHGHCLIKLELPELIKELVLNESFDELDVQLTTLLSPGGQIFKFLRHFCPVKEIEHIISLRDAKNEWEEDGIWHDDGSRILAFSLSLTLDPPQGGVLEIRAKGSSTSYKIPTPPYGTMIVFHTGQDGYEHKINKVCAGKRLIIAGWCYPSKSMDAL